MMNIEPKDLARDIQRLCNRAGFAIVGHADGTIEVTDATEWERDGKDLPVFKFTREGEALDTGILPPKQEAEAEAERKRMMEEMKKKKTVIHQTMQATGKTRKLEDGRHQQQMQTETTYTGIEEPEVKRFWVDIADDEE